MEEGRGSSEDLLQAQKAYWDEQQPSVDGMLGGLGFVHDTDIAGSRAFLDKVMPLREGQQDRGRALDCGGGIGRVTKHLLLPAGFTSVDILDVSSDFLDKAVDYVGSDALKNRFCSGLSQFDFAGTGLKWNCVWVQWCAIYLADDAFVDFFRRAAAALADENSLVVLKENALRGDRPPEPDHDDSSVTRSDSHMRRLFERAGLRVVHAEEQKGFPAELYPVISYALVPR
ncbi:methyltransferase-like protein 11A [Salpingoeca rosetta]|uniref:Alpha N-terminal protein methyltransferase 1 n=1 Tax=Salpingoeca rosetta (strain ATCC 50818 / BSB-021) TaxID=946362 RepID=F2UNN3_SALR5|nr:methyltransferase-like protein 11A [Salpingoeca rosetta]EGD79238.1 methyltransferase-like protein 11A [Salpingoeca rosetta]|eukprot:XP_004989323.1 methyltransferase-like protein 11A [Salpingoeca rosetta]